ncbi:MAG: tRNA dihydrouridine synthase DusB [candidate division Zixibacteria bacterium]|nr:tRNA dihydrouridine synthase DusB [candidate division Zixibacteria bacterium]MBU1471744.1 tRNA dihydrouridine synthase DusB [candidate division Zixibacteria bacterium]MBU2625158.1 tRNA dihydrouridine synthase DusB [candidate division Zixibacteria bacterium]
MIIGNLSLSGKVVSAPLANISGSAYRMTAREHGASLVVSEMISAEGLVRGNHKTLNMLRFRESERPVSIQLFGSTPSALADACKLVADRGVDMIDLNFGCPARKIVSKCGGAALLKDLTLTEALLSAAVKAVDIPLSMKFRSGWDRESTNFIEVGKLAEDCGVAMLTLHPRTKASGFSGKSDWSKIAELKQQVSIPVVGSGDICEPQDAVNMIEQTGCDLVMIARAAMGAPWMFGRVDAVLRGLPDPGEPDLQTKIDTCLGFARLLIEDLGERTASLRMRKQLTWYTRRWVNISRVRSLMVSVECYDDIVNFFDRYIESSHRQIA